jgi:hypothetical protein
MTCGRESINPTCPACEPRPVTDSPAYGVTPARVRYRPLASGRNPIGWRVIAASTLAAITAGIIVVLISVKSSEMDQEARGKFDRTVTIEAGQSIQYVLHALGSGPYEFDVSAHEGPVLMAFGALDAGEGDRIMNSDLSRIMESAVRVEAGRRHRMNGRLQRGRYGWIVINTSEDKAVDATIRFVS